MLKQIIFKKELNLISEKIKEIEDLRNKTSNLNKLLEKQVKELELITKENEFQRKVIETELHNLSSKKGIIDRNIKTSEKTKKYIQSIIDVGVDIHIHNPEDNWAVFCIGGNKDYVRFARLKPKDLRELQMWLKQFEYSNLKADSCLPKEVLFEYNF